MRALKELIALLIMAAAAGRSSVRALGSASPRCIMYLTGQHNVIPPQDLIPPITHVILAFLRSEVFTDREDQPPPNYGLFTTIDEVRSRFAPGTKIAVAIGGWGDWEGFQEAARSADSRKKWATRVKLMVEELGADGIDMDWEFPGGNRDDYKIIPNSEREWEIEAFVLLMEELRSTLGPDRLLTVAVPAREVDMMGFTTSTLPRITKVIDFINVMAYEIMNRREKYVRHNSGVDESKATLERYIDRGAPAKMLTVGLPYYAKWYMTEAGCDPDYPIGCPAQLMEDPDTGADLFKTGAFSWHDETPSDLAESLNRAKTDGFYDKDGSYGYWDPKELRWWSFDTPRVIERKMKDLVGSMGLGGTFAWGLGEDAPKFEHLRATIDGLAALRSGTAESDSDRRDEL